MLRVELENHILKRFSLPSAERNIRQEVIHLMQQQALSTLRKSVQPNASNTNPPRRIYASKDNPKNRTSHTEELIDLTESTPNINFSEAGTFKSLPSAPPTDAEDINEEPTRAKISVSDLLTD